MSFDPLLLSRIQFTFVVSFHIIFPAFTMRRRLEPRQGRLEIIGLPNPATRRGRSPQ